MLYYGDRVARFDVVTADCFDKGADAVTTVRELARCGRLAETVAAAPPGYRTVLAGAAYTVAWPVVFARLTRSVELRRGHHVCAGSVHRLADECLDRFEDDVEAVVEDVLAHATKPIRNLEAWIAARLTAATVDGHRRQRGQRGALQRPRLPKWLAEALAPDAWLADLAIQVLVWVGLPTTAGAGLWPIDSWAQRRAEVTGDWPGSDPPVVAREVEAVLAVMRTRDKWYADHVERPLGRKRAPLAPSWDERPAELPALSLVDAEQQDDAWLTDLAAHAVEAISRGLRRGDNPHSVIAGVLDVLFGTCTGSHDITRLPHDGAGYEERVDALLRDPAELDRVVGEVLRIIEPGGADRFVRSA